MTAKRGFSALHEGEVIRFGSKTLSAEEITEFAGQWDPQPFHLDGEAAREAGFADIIASSLHLFAICTRLFADYRPAFDILAMVGKESLRLPLPVLAGDTVTYCTTVVSIRPSRSKPDRGIVRLGDTVTRQTGEVVLTQFVDLMLRR